MTDTKQPAGKPTGTRAKVHIIDFKETVAELANAVEKAAGMDETLKAVAGQIAREPLDACELTKFFNIPSIRERMRILDEMDELKPFLTAELKKPKYNGKTARELFNEMQSDAEGKPLKTSLLLIALREARKAQRIAAPPKYEKVIQSTYTNELLSLSDKRFKNNITGERVAIIGDHEFVLTNPNAKLTSRTLKCFLYLLKELASQMPLMKAATAEKVAEYRKVTVKLDDFMETCGTTDRHEAAKTFSNIALTLLDLKMPFLVYYKTKGKDGKPKQHKKLVVANVFDSIGVDEQNRLISNGQIEFTFTDTAAVHLSQSQIMYIVDKLFLIDSRKYHHAFNLAYKLLAHKNINLEYPTENRISVKALLEACGGIPSRDELRDRQSARSGRGGAAITRDIREPFEENLIALIKEYGILESYRYCGKNGTELTDEQEAAEDPNEWLSWNLEFTFKNYPDMTERREKIREERKKAERRKKRAREKMLQADADKKAAEALKAAEG